MSSFSPLNTYNIKLYYHYVCNTHVAWAFASPYTECAAYLDYHGVYPLFLVVTLAVHVLHSAV